MTDNGNPFMDMITINFMSMTFLMAPVCFESSIKLLLPKPQELLRGFLFPDEANSVLLFNQHRVVQADFL